MLKLLYNATSSFKRNSAEISQLQEQRTNEIRDIRKNRKVNKRPPSINDLTVMSANTKLTSPQPFAYSDACLTLSRLGFLKLLGD